MLEIVSSTGTIDSKFNNPEDLIERVLKAAKNDIEQIKHGVNLESSDGDYTEVILIGIYDNGVVYKIINHVDSAMHHYDTYTSASLIVRRDGIVKFIIDGLDRRLNRETEPIGPDSMIGKCNEEILNNEYENLGNAVDHRQVKGVFKNRKAELLKQKEEALIKISIEVLEQTLEEHKTKKN